MNLRPSTDAIPKISPGQARRLWIRAQKLDVNEPFGSGGALATQKAIEHLGYVQIDTINVIERCHHHILYNRIPGYERQNLHDAQSKNKTVFEYWTHALSYVPAKDFRFFLPAMNRIKKSPGKWLSAVKKNELQKVLRMIKSQGPISIRDIQDEVLVEKEHAWGSRKPSRKALLLGFYSGRLVVNERQGMLKKYDLLDRHFNWSEKPKAATEIEILNYLVERSLRSQSIVSLESICHLEPKRKIGVKRVLEKMTKLKELVEIQITGSEKIAHWIRPSELDSIPTVDPAQVHILSPFDPLIIQRKRLKVFFDYDHRFEAYVPPAKRVFGYFTLPVLIDGQVVAALDLKTDRNAQKLLIQKWNWVGRYQGSSLKKRIEASLADFEKFQLAP